MTHSPLQSTITQRPPVVSVMGHIDHGKSTLLDFIRKTNTTEKEVGGITQRLSAYEVEHNGRRITFLDTPGHEAFGAMRSRGATVADVAILVVSAEDGVKPQTLDALKAITEAKLPYVVAINKIDKESANIERTKQSLAENEIYVEGYGGTTSWVGVSAKTGEGIPELLDTILLSADIEEKTIDTQKSAEGVVIEAYIDTKKGITATVVLRDGHIEKGMCFVAGNSFSPGRIIENAVGKKITDAIPSAPVRIIGFDSLPPVGTICRAFVDKKEAEKYAESQKASVLASKNKPQTISTTEETCICVPLVIKADTAGTLDAIRYEVGKWNNDKLSPRIIHSGIGAISENDAKTAGGKANAIIIGFAVGVEPRAKEWADRSNIPIVTFDIIYALTEWLEKALKDRVPKTDVDEAHGKAKIVKIFSNTKDKYILGGKVESGSIKIGDEVKIIRREEVLGKGKIRSLQQQKEVASEVREGFEFGAQVQAPMELVAGDRIESFTTVSKSL